MAGAVNVAEEVLAGVLQAAEHLKGGVVAAEPGPVESLRWAGALPLLLRDLRVPRIVAADALLRCETRAQVRRLLAPLPWEDDGADEEGLEAEDDGEAVVERLVLLVSGFLWDYEPALRRLLATGAVAHLTVCSSLSERAHECFDFSKAGGEAVPAGAKAGKAMAFDAFAAALGEHLPGSKALAPRPVASPRHERPGGASKQQQQLLQQVGNGDDEEDWDWTDDNDPKPTQSASWAATQAKPAPTSQPSSPSVRVVHLPLNVAALLSNKVPGVEPSLFVLSHPVCASAFPLMLHQVQTGRASDSGLPPTSSSVVSVAPSSAERAKLYTHVKEVQPEHIPDAFRRSLRLLAHVLGELLSRARLDVKERIFALGATSLKIGHTLLRILNELDDGSGESAHFHGDKQPASVIIVDRTCDLAGPTSFGVSLLDRVLALLPQSPGSDAVGSSISTRANPHITEIFPLHGCEPIPPIGSYGPTGSIASHPLHHASPFVSRIPWNGGASLAHPPNSGGEQIFRSLAFRPAKLALRDLDRRLQEVEHALVQRGKIIKSSSVRKPGEKKPSTRGRDVVQRRMCNILDAGEPTTVDESALIELGIVILETLERMERGQGDWDRCRESAVRQTQLRKQSASEWIVPELADRVQRQLGSSSSDLLSLTELLTLLVHGFALSSQAPMEDFTAQMLRKVMSEMLLKAAVASPTSLQAQFPDFFDQISIHANAVTELPTATATVHGNDADEDWDWNDDGQNARTSSPRRSLPSTNSEPLADNVVAKALAESFAATIVERLQECGQEFAQLNDEEYESTNASEPRSLVAQLCRAALDPTRDSIPELQHIVDVSEQLTRAGIDLLKSGFSRFGFGVGGNGGTKTGGNRRVLGNSQVLVVFVVGGITFEEVQEVHNALQELPFQVILGGTTVTNSDMILEQVLKQ